jgi:hypothetical protein
MTTERQKAANQANAGNSTGPKTPEGKAAVRFNAFRHGLLARDVLLPGEDEDALEDLRNRIRADFSPADAIEEFLVERLVNLMWRLQRLGRLETALLYSRVHNIKAELLKMRIRSYEERYWDEPGRKPMFIKNKARHSQAKEALAQAENESGRDEVLLGLVIAADANDSDALANITRYERNFERSLFRILEELNRHRDRRRNRRAPPILDVVTLDAGDTE